MTHELGCPCGGKVEERGSVRVYIETRVTLDTETGLRRSEQETWTAPIEWLELDNPPFHCLECDRQLTIHELAVIEEPT